MAVRDADWFEPDLSTYDRTLGDRLRRERFRDGNNRLFYARHAWRRLRDKVLAAFRWECQDCLAKSPRAYRRATNLHHVLHVREYPGFALTEFVNDGEGRRRRVLVPLCHECHQLRHGRGGMAPIAERAAMLERRAMARRMADEAKLRNVVTDERW